MAEEAVNLIDNLLDQVGEDNLTDNFDDKKLDALAQSLIRGFESDEDSRSKWLSDAKEHLKLAMQVREKKSVPWENASNVKFPLLSISAIHFNARMYPALVSGFDIVKGVTIGKDLDGTKAESANRVSKHMSFQLMQQMEDWEDDMDTALFVLPIVGCFFKKVYFDPIDRINRSDVILPQDLSVNYYAKNLKDAPRVTHIFAQSTNEIMENMAKGLYRDIGLFDDIDDQYNDNPLEQGALASTTPELGIKGESHVDGVDGTSQPGEVDFSTPHEVLEMHCWIDLDGDYYEEPYVVTIHRATQKILRIVARYQASGVILSDDGEKLIKIEPDTYFVDYKFIPNPQSGVYSIGFGTLLGSLNDSVNTLINQLTDAGTLSNMQGGWIAPGVKVKGGVFKFRPGEWKLAQITGDDLHKKIVPLPVREPSNVLFLLLGTLIESSEKLSSVIDIMTGEMPGQNTKATVVLQAIEQGSKVFNAIAKRLYGRFSKELKLLYALNSVYLDEHDYFNVIDDSSSTPMDIFKTDYDMQSVDIMPSADPSMSTQSQKLAKIEAAERFVGVTINKEVYTQRFLEAIEMPGIDELMEMEEPAPDPEFEFEKRKTLLEFRHKEALLKLEVEKAKAQAAKDEAASLKTLSEIKNMIDTGDIKRAQQVLAERQQIIDARQKQFENTKELAQMQLDNQQQGKVATTGEE